MGILDRLVVTVVLVGEEEKLLVLPLLMLLLIRMIRVVSVVDRQEENINEVAFHEFLRLEK
jgi:hypothetical protein